MSVCVCTQCRNSSYSRCTYILFGRHQCCYFVFISIMLSFVPWRGEWEREQEKNGQNSSRNTTVWERHTLTIWSLQAYVILLPACISSSRRPAQWVLYNYISLPSEARCTCAVYAKGVVRGEQRVSTASCCDTNIFNNAAEVEWTIRQIIQPHKWSWMT